MQEQSPDREELPMSISLMGHEPYYSEFSMDAEMVMQQLGIKRSRLRQISGNELRVGRKRVEHHIRPFYRPDDVESYLSWTRRTASHQKSSEALRSAAKELSEMKEDLIRGAARENADHFQDLRDLLGYGFRGARESDEAQSFLLQKLSAEHERRFLRAEEHLKQLQHQQNLCYEASAAQIRALSGSVDALGEILSEQLSRVSALVPLCERLAGKIEMSSSEISSSLMKEIHKEFKELTKHWDKAPSPHFHFSRANRPGSAILQRRSQTAAGIRKASPPQEAPDCHRKPSMGNSGKPRLSEKISG
ncbi:MAG: hypothetical protein H6618_06995 [Deltaproteobacteria bacterium]|nr:hypothetical protein [Deltaproteobacteria bacterium]